jgi:hypothetical protein
MTSYRCYVLDKNDRISSATSLEAADDAEALSKAALKIRMSLIFPIIEVWQGKRLVGRVPQRDTFKSEKPRQLASAGQKKLPVRGSCQKPTVTDAHMSQHVTERSRLRDGRVVLWSLPMTADLGQLRELARKVATAAANQIAAVGPTAREHRVAPSTSKPDRWSQSRTGRDFWGLTFILAAGVVIGLAIVAAGGWIF